MQKKFTSIMAAILSLSLATAVWAEGSEYNEVPLSYRGVDTGWSILFEDSLLNAVGIHIHGLREQQGAIVLEIDKWFYGTNQPGGQATPFDLVFSKRFDSNYSKFVIDDEYIVNKTGTVWQNFHMQLISDGGAAGFLEEPNQPINTKNKFGTVTFTGHDQGYQGLATRINFSNGNVGTRAPSNIFQPGYLGGDITIYADPTLSIGEAFVLKESTAPEPVSVMLFGIAGLIGWLKRR